MKSVRYLKVVLTVIATCLVWICLRDVALVATANAKVDVIPGRYQISGHGQDGLARVDSLSGQVCFYAPGATEVEPRCTSTGK